MSIGTTIKRLRREKDITQEQLAEYLGITSRAISQWECDRTAPDISLLPALCHVFGVSSDLLLGIDIEKNKEEIKKYLDKASDCFYRGMWEESTALLREANKKFPRDYKIMSRLADSLVAEYSRKGISKYDEVFELCNRILEDCTESTTRYEALSILAVAYDCAGKKEENLKLAKEMPEAHFSREKFMLSRWEGNADLEKRQIYIAYLISQLTTSIGGVCQHRNDCGELMLSADERINLYKLSVELLEVLFPNGDYQYMAQDGEIACSHIAIELVRKNDIEGAWEWLEKSVDFALHMDTYDFDLPHTSPILRGYASGGWIMEEEGNRSQSLLEWLICDEELSALRSDNRYKTLVERLEKVAKKP